MALITGTLAIVANTSSNLTLNTAELEALITDTYWSETLNWKKVIVRYAYLGQKLDIIFNGQTGLAKAKFAARSLNGVWKIQGIAIVDYMGANYSLSQGQVPSLISYNISVSGGVSYSTFIAPSVLAWTKFNGTLADYGSQGGLEQSGAVSFDNGAFGGAITGDFELEYKFTASATTTTEFMAGISYSVPAIGGFPTKNLYVSVGTAADWVGGGSTAWTERISLAGFISIGFQNTFNIKRVGGVITGTITSILGTTVKVMDASNTGAVYPHVVMYNNIVRLDSTTIVSASAMNIAWTRINSSVIQFSGADGGLIGGNSDWEQGASNGPAITGDFTLEYRVKNNADIRIGYQKSATPPTAAANPDSGIRIQSGGAGNTFGPMAVVGSRYDVSGVTEKSFKFIRVGSVISLSIDSDTPTVFESFSGSIYPHAAIFTTGSGGSLTYAKKS